MEENEFPWELSSIFALVFIEIMTISLETISHPLFSCIITLYTLFLLYFPQIFLKIAFSPVFILTLILLLSLLRLGATQRTQTQNQNNSIEEKLQADVLQRVHKWVTSETRPGFEETFVEWDVRAPLEVIYEEGEEGEDKYPDPKERDQTRLERYPSLSLCYPETDSDSSSDGDFAVMGNWVSPENVCFRWEEEDREGLIEIALDGSTNNKSDDMGFHVEEENLIEIDISPVKNDEFSGDLYLGSVNVD